MEIVNKYFKYKTYIILCLIFILALITRLLFLGSLPKNLMEDEVLSGYVGRFILENGVDLYGNPWPLWYFDKFGDFYIIGPMYLTGLSTLLFGFTSFAVRFPVAFFGSIVVLPLFFLVKKVFKKDSIALFSAFFISIAPWHIILSRSSAEGVLGSTFFVFGILFLVYFLQSRKISWLIISVFFLLSTYFIYHPFRLYVPLTFIPLFILFIKVLKNNFLNLYIPLLVSTVFFFFLTIYIITTPWGSGRLGQTSIFSDLARVEGRQTEQVFNLGANRLFEARLFHNKILGFGREYVRQYLSYFSPNYLFTDGGAESRYDVPDQGLLYLSFLILLFTLIVPIKSNIRYDKRLKVFFIFLLFLSPLPAAFTYYGAPNIHRSIFLVIMLAVFLGYTAYRLTLTHYGKLALIFISLILSFEFIYFWHQYSTQSDIYTSLRRNDGQVELIQFLEKETGRKKIYLPAEGTMSLYLLFFTNNTDPKLVNQFGFDVKIKSVERYNFTESSCPANDLNSAQQNIILVNRYDCPDVDKYTNINNIKGVNQLLGYRIYSN